MKQKIYGDYVLTLQKNAFNEKFSCWISKKGIMVALYCFSVLSEDEFERYSDEELQTYIRYFDTRMGGNQ